MRTLIGACAALALGLACGDALANSASPHPVHLQQPDGTEIVVRIRGDERFHWEEDANGYTVLRREGRYVYARQGADGRLQPTDLEVGKADPRAHGLARRTLPSPAAIAQLRANAPGSQSNDTQGAPEQVVPAGQVVNLVIPIRFSNHQSRVVPGEADLDVLFNNAGPHVLAPTGSVRDVYLENSYGQLDLVSTIANWVDVSNSEQYYANGSSGDQTLHQALIEALNAVDQYIDFRDYDLDGDGYIDSIAFVHSGYGAEWGGVDADGTHYSDRIWSHRWVIWDTNGDGVYNPALDQPWQSEEGVRVWDYHISPTLWGVSGSQIGRIGVIAHETGHFFGLPDLYDTDGGGEGIGSYGLMANSWGFDGTQKYPPHMSPWSKIELGWLSPTALAGAGQYALNAAEDNPEVYRVDHGYPSGEYLLIENRQPIGFDGDMPQGGLAIWHIDEAAGLNAEGYPGQVTQGSPWPENGRHYRIALLQADGQYNLERGQNRGDSGDVWRAGGVSEINGNTLPGTDAYQGGVILETGNRVFNISASAYSATFEYDDGLTPQDPPAAPSGLAATDDGNGNVDLAWSDNADNEDGYRVFRDGVEIATLAANSQSYTDSSLAAGTYDYFVRAFNGAGTADSGTVSVAVVAPAIVYASGESTTWGTLSGSYLDTVALAGEETLTEVESGGRKSDRTSRLRHVWQVDNVAGGGTVMLYVNAHAPANGEGDDFEFSYSLDGGASYAAAFTLANGSDQVLSVALPEGTGGSVLVRVEDSDRGKGNRTLDSVSVRQLYVESSGEVVLTAPSNLVATALSPSEIELAWSDGSGETQYHVEEWDGAIWLAVDPALPANTTGTVIGGLAPESTHTYRVCGIDGLSQPACSDQATATTQPVGGAPVLSASGYKLKGVQHASLSWTNVADVIVYRDGAEIGSGTNFSFDDNIGNKGGGSYVYQVCDQQNAGNCSDTVTVSF